MKIKRFVNRLFNGTVFLQAPLKAYELDDRIMKEKYGLTIRELDYNDDAAIELWKSIIHTSYDDCHYTTVSAKNFFYIIHILQTQKHICLKELKITRRLQLFQ